MTDRRTRETLTMIHPDPAKALRLLCEWWRAVHNIQG